MAVTHGGLTNQKISLVAGADLSALQYHFVKMNGTATTVVVCSGATDFPIGVLQNAPESGETAEIVVVGATKVVSGGALTANGVIGTGADAKAADDASSSYPVGRLIGAAAAEDVIASALVDCIAPTVTA